MTKLSLANMSLPVIKNGFQLLVTLFAVVIAISVSCKAQAEVTTHPPEGAANELRKLERLIKRQRLTDQEIGEHTKQVVEYRNQASQCINDGESELAQFDSDLADLGEKVRGENWEVTSKRQSLQTNKAQLERNLAQCRLILLRSDDIYQSLLNYQKQVTKQHLLSKGPDILTLLKDNWQQPSLWITATRQFIFTDSGLGQFFAANWLSLAWGLLFSVLLAIAARLFLVNLIHHGHWRVDYTSRFLCAILTSLRRYAIPTFGTLFFISFIAVYYHNVPDFLGAIILVLPIFFLLITTVRIFLTPPEPAVSFVALHQYLAHAFAQRINYLLVLLLVGYLLFQTILSQSLPEPALLLTRGIFATFVVLNLIWLVLLLAKVPRYTNARVKRVILVGVIASTLLMEWLGYRNLSLYILRALIGTVIAIGTFSLLKRLLSESYQGLATGRAEWHKTIRQWLSVKPGESIPGLGWLRFIIHLALWIGLVWVLMRVWDFSEATWQQLIATMQSGFTVGSLNIIPTRILLAIGSFALLTVVTGWLKNRLAKHWLAKSRLDRGAREATETISGYIGFAITIIVSLSVAGVDFSHLALIAGALSVGIGFGLQNIVNNFVSGLILLFERPIKTGDWIVVGNTEGYVKRIRIRSTQIQTFDRADVVVPNSELISGQVTNWMLHDTQGRVNIQVGVAYGSDTEKVRDILMETAMSHPLVIHDSDVYQPRVLFRQFGESSLDFELRVYVKNIDNRLGVISDLNFAIDKAFRENNIEIPFPQRDLHIRSMPESLKAPDKKDS